MSDKSIAEIIGWTWHEGSGAWKAPGRQHFVHARRDDPPGPTPDDMLAWLRERGRAVSAFLNADSVSVHVERLEGPWLFYVQPTLHAALEAAVRAVHDAEEHPAR